MKRLLKLFLISGLVFTLVPAAEAARRRKKPKQAPQRNTAPSQGYDSYEPEERNYSATGGHNMAGCGLGSLAIEDNGKWAQVGASFLNGTGIQTFAITFGTSNCAEDGVASAAREKDVFVESNYSDIRRDLAVGSGAYLTSLAKLYGCQGEAVTGFSQALQKNQEKVLNSSAERASGVIDEVVKTEGVACQG